MVFLSFGTGKSLHLVIHLYSKSRRFDPKSCFHLIHGVFRYKSSVFFFFSRWRLKYYLVWNTILSFFTFFYLLRRRAMPHMRADQHGQRLGIQEKSQLICSRHNVQNSLKNFRKPTICEELLSARNSDLKPVQLYFKPSSIIL